MTRRNFAKRPREVLEALGAVNGTGYNKAKSLKSQQRRCDSSLVILKLDLELIATESPFAPNNYLSDPNQHIKSLPKSTRRKIVNLPEPGGGKLLPIHSLK